jgi:hypothetical protein
MVGDAGVDPGRNSVVDCGRDDIDFQDDAPAELDAAGLRLLQCGFVRRIDNGTVLALVGLPHERLIRQTR